MPAKIGSTGTMDILVYMKSWLDAKCTGTQKLVITTSGH